MLSAPLRAAIERIHATSTRCCLITTGAGGTSISSLLGVAGCSRTLLEGQVPYHQNCLAELIGFQPQSAVAATTSRAIAQHAYAKALKISQASSTDDTICGVGATSAIATDRTRRGLDQVFVSVWQRNGAKTYHLVMSKEGYTREQQEAMVAAVILHALCIACRLNDIAIDQLCNTLPWTAGPAESLPANFEGLTNEDMPVTKTVVDALMTKEVDHVTFNPHGIPRLAMSPYVREEFRPTSARYLLYPGSFNPVHQGHLQLVEAAQRSLVEHLASKEPSAEEPAQQQKLPIYTTFEISSTIADKADLTPAEFEKRVAQFTIHGHRVSITSAKLFVEKAQLFPHHGMIVGADTVVRILDPKYYGNSEENMLEALGKIRSLGCFFLVGGRLISEKWTTLDDVTVPDAVKDIFVPIDGFRMDISSTEIRKAQEKMQQQQ